MVQFDPPCGSHQLPVFLNFKKVLLTLENERHSAALRKVLVVCTFAMVRKCLPSTGYNN